MASELDEMTRRILALRLELLRDGIVPPKATPAILAKHNLVAWSGTYLGVECIESPLVSPFDGGPWSPC